MYVEGTLVSILNGLGETFDTFKHSLMSACIKISFIFFAIPIFGIKAYLWGLLAGHLFSCLIHFRSIKKITKLDLDVITFLVKPILAAIFSASIVKFLYIQMIPLIGESLGLLLVSSIVMFGIYLIALVLLKAVTRGDLKRIKNM